MNANDLVALLEGVATGAVQVDVAVQTLRAGPFKTSDLGFANIDHHRSIRHGLGEVVYGESKTAEQLVAICGELGAAGDPVLATRVNPEKLAALAARFPTGRVNAAGRTFVVNPPARKDARSGEPFVAILAAGTSDIPVAEEASEVCISMSIAFEQVYDVGVSGLHRLLGKLDDLQGAAALVVIAGMEGALPSVVAGLVGSPVFAVPTSVGYGASFGGLAALLAMLNSCAPGVTVVNIDNGFSAAFAACTVVRLVRDR